MQKPNQTPVSFVHKRSRAASRPLSGVFVVLCFILTLSESRIQTWANSKEARMSCDERTALLATQRGHHQEAHIVVVPLSKDPKDYEPVFTTADYSYGLSLEELLPFELDPWWQKVRRLCLACLGVAFTLTLLASLCLAYFHDDAIVCASNRRMLSSTLPPPPAPLALVNNGTLLVAAS